MTDIWCSWQTGDNNVAFISAHRPNKGQLPEAILALGCGE